MVGDKATPGPPPDQRTTMEPTLASKARLVNSHGAHGHQQLGRSPMTTCIPLEGKVVSGSILSLKETPNIPSSLLPLLKDGYAGAASTVVGSRRFCPFISSRACLLLLVAGCLVGGLSVWLVGGRSTQDSTLPCFQENSFRWSRS